MKRYNYPRGALSPIEAALLACIEREPGINTLGAQERLRSLVRATVAHQTLYVLVQRLRDEGLIRTGPADTLGCKPHKLTSKGRRKLSDTLAYWDALERMLLT